MRIGAEYGSEASTFTVWAPLIQSMRLHLVRPEDRYVPMEKDARGYWSVEVEGLPPDSRYFYAIDGSTDLPDPTSHFQPEGVHGPSQMVHHEGFSWSDGKFLPAPLDTMVFYEVHIGTFTPEGTFEAAIGRLDDLVATGITALEIMPVAQFPGDRNWGYDGTYLFAPQNSYGGPEGLRKLVDACHLKGLAVFLDVVYNHFGPEGNYIAQYGPYFTKQYVTPWGSAVNFDSFYSDEVRNFYLENAVHWLKNYHFDGLRLDAIDQIKDTSARHILQEISDRVFDFSIRVGKKHYLVAESDLNDSRVLAAAAVGGHGLDAQWSDDFHHAMHALLTGERHGYYTDYGQVHHLAQAFRQSFTYSGQYSEFRKRRFGNSVYEFPPFRFVVNLQNHDQIGNRAEGNRISSMIGFEASKLAAGALILSPYIPFIFMGQEYADDAPFQYFVSFGDKDLIEAVRKGRKEEFSAFAWQGEVPDPESEETFERSKLSWNLRGEGTHRILLEFYSTLLKLRKEHPALLEPARERSIVFDDEVKNVIMIRRWFEHAHMLLLLNFGKAEAAVSAPYFQNEWTRILCSAARKWGGSGDIPPETVTHEQPVHLPPESITLYEYRGTR